ncbi:hypothetical protein MC885_001627, partial [Smutsia gigantea]
QEATGTPAQSGGQRNPGPCAAGKGDQKQETPQAFSLIPSRKNNRCPFPSNPHPRGRSRQPAPCLAGYICLEYGVESGETRRRRPEAAAHTQHRALKSRSCGVRMGGDPLPPYISSLGTGEFEGRKRGGQGVAGAPGPHWGGWIRPHLKVNWRPTSVSTYRSLECSRVIAQPQRSPSRPSALCGRDPQRREEGRGLSHLPLRSALSSERLHRLQGPGALGATEPRDRGGNGAGGQELGGSGSPPPAPPL